MIQRVFQLRPRRYLRFVRAGGRARKIHRVSKTQWSEMSWHFRQWGLLLDGAEPSPGTVVGFDEMRRGIVLTTGARTPEDVAAAIRLMTGPSARKIGRAPNYLA